MNKIFSITLLIVSFFLIGILVPYGLNIPIPSNEIISSGNYTCFGCGEVYDPTIPILMVIILPILILLSLFLKYFPKKIKVKKKLAKQ